MNTFSAGEMIKFGWETFKKRPWLFVAVTLAITIANSLVSRTFPGVSWTEQTGLLISTRYIAGTVINYLFQIFVAMGTIAFYLKAHDDVALAHMKDLWHPEPFVRYLGLSLLLLIILGIGFVLLIIPGIILSIMFQFAPYLVIDKGMGPIEALKESARMTSGYKWNLVRFNVVIIGVVILGAICLVVGLLAAIPVMYLAIAHVYRTLGTAPAETVAVQL